MMAGVVLRRWRDGAVVLVVGLRVALRSESVLLPRLDDHVLQILAKLRGPHPHALAGHDPELHGLLYGIPHDALSHLDLP